MRIVAANELQQWLTQGDVLEQDSRGPKVIRLASGQLLKIFRPRRRLWLARFKPAAKRFAQNAEKLKALHITAPVVSEYFWLGKDLAVSACLYTPLPGISLEQLYKQSRPGFNQQLPAFAAFIQSLHQRGIYFRSLHLGNVLQLPEGGFGLIDFLDIRFKQGPLRKSLVKRNLDHLHGYLQRSQIKDFPWERLVAACTQAAAQPGKKA